MAYWRSKVKAIFERVLGDEELQASHFAHLDSLQLRMGRSKPKRAMMLACCPLDRAYCGNTGTKADLFLSELLALPHRLGIADGIHVYDSCGRRTWEAERDQSLSS